MSSQRQKQRRASVERHEISRPEVTERLADSDDRVRFLKVAAIALDGPDAGPYAEQGAEHDGLIWNRRWDNSSEDRRRARALLHYAQC